MSSLSRGWECVFPGCGKKFTRKEHLNRHNLVHNPEHQYKCHVCGRRYARSDVYKRHLKQHDHSPELSNSRGERGARQICLPCRERNTQCDGHSPCEACMSSWTECRFSGADNGQRVDTSQSSAILSAGQTQTPWFPPTPEGWVSQPFSTTPVDFSSAHQTQAAATANSHVSPESSTSTNGAESTSHDVSNGSNRSSQPPSSPWWQQRTAPRPLESLHVSDLENKFFRNSLLTKRLVDVFFSEVHPHWLILHEPTFEVEQAPTVLLASMVMLASWLQNGSEHEKISPVVFDEVIRIRMDLNPPLYILQAALFYVVYTFGSLSADGMVARALNLTGLLVSTCRHLGIFNGQYTCHEMANMENCACPFLGWRVQEQLNRFAFSVLRIDTYLSILLDHPPSVRYQELCIPLPKTAELWAAANEEERRALQWNEPAGREKALFSFFMRDVLDANRVGNLPYRLTEIDYHLSTCATESHLWEAAREAHSSMSDELVNEASPVDFARLSEPHMTLWRHLRRSDCEVRAGYFAGRLDTRRQHRIAPLTFTLMYISTLKLHAPLNTLRPRGHYHKSRPGAAIPTRRPAAHLRGWVASGCPRSALWGAARICRIFAIETAQTQTQTQTQTPHASSRRSSRILNPLLIPGVLMSAVLTCSYAKSTRSCASCRLDTTTTTTTTTNALPSSCSSSSSPPALNLFDLDDHDPALERWRRGGEGVPYWGSSSNAHNNPHDNNNNNHHHNSNENCNNDNNNNNNNNDNNSKSFPVCQCRLSDIAAWFRDAFAGDESAEMEFVLFLAELSRET